MNARTSVSEVAGTVVISIDGVVDLSSIGQVHTALNGEIRRHPGRHLAVDLDGVTALDDAGLGVLLGAAAAARDAGGDLRVVCTSARVRDRLRRTRFDRAVDVVDTIGSTVG